MGLTRKFLIIFTFCCFAAVSPGAREAVAATSGWWKTDHGAVRLVAASDAVGTARELRLGLQFRMKPGWKIYWRSPGDAGFPPSPDWAGSSNLFEVKIDWPAPERFTVLGLQTLGYKNEVLLPLTVAPLEPGKPLGLKARIPFLTCSDICVPYEAKLALSLPAGPETSSREQAEIDRFARLVPIRDGPSGLRIVRAEVAGQARAQVIQVALAADAPLERPDIFLEGPEGFNFAKPKVRLSDGGKTALLRIAVGAPRKGPAGLAGKTVSFTVVDGDRAIERAVVLTATVGVPTGARGGPASTMGFALILVFAVLGGLILNLMPCVLPVLSIKLLSVVGHGGGEARDVRSGFLASAAGIVASFLVLGSAAIALKSAGLAAGWGIQFQQPVFLAVMILILVIFASNLFGLFEFRLPGRLGDAAAGVGRGHGMTGHFLTGAFATLLATPCSAPFLGTAVGFALSRGWVEIYGVFVALGLGLALPYLAVAAFPSIATRLPRPGPWMITLRRILGLALIATAGWLATVLLTQSGIAVASLVTLLMAAVVVAIWQVPHLAGRARGATWAVVAALAILSVGISGGIAGRGGRDAPADEFWRRFDPAAIAREVSAGRSVFVDVTADWCITCQVNKALVLNRGEVRRRLATSGLTLMRADWTRPDPVISDFLASFGRYGIPFNVVYGPGAPEGVPLPEILTNSSVLAALDRAARDVRVSGR